jgi:uncharacterized repeat protein (TIGR02543 family)
VPPPVTAIDTIGRAYRILGISAMRGPLKPCALRLNPQKRTKERNKRGRPTKSQPTQAPPPINEAEQAEEEFREDEAVREALETEPAAIGLDTEDLDDLTAKVNEALATYEKLPTEAKEALAEEKTALDAVKEKISHVGSAQSFRKGHEETLAKNPSQLQTPADAAAFLPDLYAALEAFEDLPEAAQELLPDDKARLESLLAKAETLKPPVRHTLTFDSHEGSAVGAVTVNEGRRVYQPMSPARAGYAFAGWFSAESGGELYAWPLRLTESFTAHAHWTALKYAIAYNLNGGTNGDNPAGYTVEDLPLALTDPAREGYRFQIWHDNGRFTNSPTTEIPVGSLGAKTFHARWTESVYTVQYEANGGTGTMEPSSHTYNEPKTLAANAFARSGYVFREWTAEPDGNGPAYADGERVVNLSFLDGATVQLYARWNHAITYNLNGGSNGNNPPRNEDNPTGYAAADLPLELQAPARDGYSFQGWHDNDGLSGSPISEIPAGSAGAKTFHASWSLNTYTIKYELYGGDNDPANPKTYTVEDLTHTLAEPVLPGYEFAGWHRNAAMTRSPVAEIPAGSFRDQTFHASWKLSLPIGIALRAVAAPSLANETATVSQAVEFTLAEASGLTDIIWRWDGGEPIEGAVGSTYTLEAHTQDPGIYELSVVANDESGKKLSARCRVAITAE